MTSDILAAMAPLPNTKIVNWALPEAAFLPRNRHTLIEVARIFGSLTIGLETMTPEIVQAATDACKEVGRFGPKPELYLKWSPLHNCEAIPYRWAEGRAPSIYNADFWVEVRRFQDWQNMVVANAGIIPVAGFLIDREAIKVLPGDDKWNAGLLQIQRVFDSMITAYYGDIPRYVYMLGDSGQYNMGDSPGNKGTRLYFPLDPVNQLRRLAGWEKHPDYQGDRAVYVSTGCGYEGTFGKPGPWNNHLEIPLPHFRNLGAAFAGGNAAAIFYPSILNADVWNPDELLGAFAEGAGA